MERWRGVVIFRRVKALAYVGTTVRIDKNDI